VRSREAIGAAAAVGDVEGAGTLRCEASDERSEAMKPKSVGLGTMIQAECANCTRPGECLLRGSSCVVLNGIRCSYFEKHVLSLAAHPQDKSKAGVYGKAVRQYAKLCSGAIPAEDVMRRVIGEEMEIRRCECGSALVTRQRMCSECSREQRLATYRQAYWKRKSEKAG